VEISYNDHLWHNREKFYRVLVTDGNFKADHVKQKNPDDDVALTGNGEAYMTGDAQYKQHINTSVEEKQKSTRCYNHRASDAANKSQKNHLDCTGLAACACGRHGCFVPNSVADFQKGER
jgi:hypothetical protein